MKPSPMSFSFSRIVVVGFGIGLVLNLWLVCYVMGGLLLVDYWLICKLWVVEMVFVFEL